MSDFEVQFPIIKVDTSGKPAVLLQETHSTNTQLKSYSNSSREVKCCLAIVPLAVKVCICFRYD